MLTADDDRVEEVAAEYVSSRIRPSGGKEDGVRGLERPIRDWYVAFTVDYEVLNGGFNQFFFNAPLPEELDVAGSFRRLGISEGAEIVDGALSLLPAWQPRLDEARRVGTTDAFSTTYETEPFGALDDEYAAHEEDFRELRIAFLREYARRVARWTCDLERFAVR